MKRILTNTVTSFGFHLHSTITGVSLTNASSLLTTAQVMTFSNSSVLTSYRLKTVGCKNLRKGPGLDIISDGYFIIQIQPYLQAFNMSTSKWIDNTDPAFDSLQQLLYIYPIDFDLTEPLNNIIKPEFVDGDVTYMASGYTLKIELIQPGPLQPLMYYDALNIDPSYHLRQCYLQHELTIEN